MLLVTSPGLWPQGPWWRGQELSCEVGDNYSKKGREGLFLTEGTAYAKAQRCEKHNPEKRLLLESRLVVAFSQ